MRPFILMISLILATLACTLTRNGEGDFSTPTPIAGISQLQTVTNAVTPTRSTSLFNITPTPIAAPPTRLPTLFPTPLQFNPAPVSNNSGVNTTIAGEVAVAANFGDPTAGAPQQNGFYFPTTIVYQSGNEVMTVGLNDPAGNVLGQGAFSRSNNGLLVSLLGKVSRPDGANLGVTDNRSTVPTWANDNQTAYWGTGNQLFRWQNGGVTAVDTVKGNLIRVLYSPDGGTLAFASANEIKLMYGDGNIRTIWDSATESITAGPVWALRGEQWGIYVELNNGRRLFIGGELSDMTTSPETLQVLSPIQAGASVFPKPGDGGLPIFAVAFPGQPEREFRAKSLFDISWSPFEAQIVYTTPTGEMMWLDIPSGNSRLLTQNASSPVWSAPRYWIH